MAPPRVATWGGAFFRTAKIVVPLKSVLPLGSCADGTPQYVWDVSPSVPGLQTGWPQICARNFAKSAFYGLLDAGHQAGAASIVGRADGCARQPVGRQAIPPALF
jgi:hypothetical protein